MENVAGVGDAAAMRKRPPRPPVTAEDTRPRSNQIRAWRKYRDLTLEELGAAAGLSTATISNLENRKAGYTWESLERLADALECQPGQLLSDPPPGILGAGLGDLEPGALQHVLDLLAMVRKRP